MVQRLLWIPWVYWAVLRAMALCFATIMFWVVINILLDNSSGQATRNEAIYEGGFWWLVYSLIAVVAVFFVQQAGAPAWIVKATAAAVVLAVPPIYWAFHRTAGGSAG